VVMSPMGLADGMLRLQRMGCHNINLVTPTPHLPGILEALNLAAAEGLSLPIVYNCGGYESVEALKLLENIVDIFMPDIKYGDNESGRRYSGVGDYFERVREAVKEMHRQVGDLVVGRDGVATRGLLIRHLVMPGDAANSGRVLEFIAGELSRRSYVNIMDQYRPCFHAADHPEISRRITGEEYRRVVARAVELGLHRGFIDEAS